MGGFLSGATQKRSRPSSSARFKASCQELEIIRPHELLIKKNKENGLDEDSKILFNRLQNVEKATRLGDYIGTVDKEIMKETKEKLKLVLDLE